MADTEQDTRTLPPGAAQPAADLGEVLARFDELRLIGRGGMGEVYSARHRHLRRPVAIKVCLPGGHLDRFEREARLLAQLRSPHVVPVHDFDRLADGRAVLVMEWVDGGDLRGALDRQAGPLPESMALPWMTQVCDGMAAAERQGIVHRDLKPSNILLDAGTGRAMVADFGLAWSPDVDPLSLTGAVMGTPYYMAPEQAEDSRRVDTRADVYSFGATFYHLLTGRPPFDGPSHFTILFRHKMEPLTAPRAVNPALSDRVAGCLERCLAKSPAERFGSFAEVRASLTPSAPSAWEADGDPRLAAYLDRYKAKRAGYLGSVGSAVATEDVYTFPGGRSLTVCVGDIARQKVGAVVSSDDGELSMGGGVSYALLRVAGDALAKEAAKYTPVRAGRVVVTSGGKLPARFVFHAVTIGTRDGSFTGPTRDLILEILDGCFYHADTLSVQSLAVPLLGTGVGGFAADVCLDTLFRSLARKLLTGLTAVRDVRIVLRLQPREAGSSPTPSAWW